MPTLKELRLKARLTVNKLSQEAGVSHETIKRAEKGERVLDVLAYQILETLNRRLGTNYTLDDIENLKVN